MRHKNMRLIENMLRPFQGIGFGGAALLAAAAFLPWWSQKGISVTGFSEVAGSPGIVILVLAVLAGLLTGIRLKGQARWLRLVGGIATALTLLHLWRGIKLHAIGWGLGVMLAGGLLVLLASFFCAKEVKG
jgi:uncharacterized membrane protein